MKVALIHDWLTGMRGGERCLEVFCELFPEADLFTLIHRKASTSLTIERMSIKTSFLQHIPGIFSHYRNYLPLFPKAIESFDLSGYELVLSSSHCVAKGVRVSEKALHICYCYTPMRYAWLFFQEYFGTKSFLKKKLIELMLNRMRKWDIRACERVDLFVAISDNIRQRIKKYYNREAEVIYPPVDVSRFKVSAQQGDFYLIVCALVPYKKIDIAIEAFNISGKRLVIIGTGSSQSGLKKIAGNNIEFLGWVDDVKLADYYAKCRALIFPGEEDFGIVLVEAQACGKPVIAYGKGGALETVTNQTGIFFFEQTPQALFDAVMKFEKIKDSFNQEVIRNNALRFDREIFKTKIKHFIEEKLYA